MNAEGQTAPDPTSEEPTDPTPSAELQAALAECGQLKEQLLRVMAEAQNVQRRLRQQMEDERKYAAQPLVERLLPVLDSFERSLASVESGASLESLTEGLKSIDRQFRQSLESFDVVRIGGIGQPYDPQVHEALLAVEDDGVPEDTVMEEIEPGYVFRGRVVRAAKVKVSRKP